MFIHETGRKHCTGYDVHRHLFILSAILKETIIVWCLRSLSFRKSQFPFSVFALMWLLWRKCLLPLETCDYFNLQFYTTQILIPLMSITVYIFFIMRSYLNEKVAAPVHKTEINDRGNPLRWPCNTIRKRWRSLGRYSSLADQSHGV
jgi:hypothetical protein